MEQVANIGVEAVSGNSPSSKITSSFLYHLLATLLSIAVYAFKLKEDVDAVVEYRSKGDLLYSAVSVLILVLPSLLSAAYFGFKELIEVPTPAEDAQQCCCPCAVTFWKVAKGTAFGLLLLPRQIIQYVAKLGYISGKLFCSGHCNATPEEAKVIEGLVQKNQLLEFFEDFYAGFLATFFQLYILYQENSGKEDTSAPEKQTFFLLKQLIASLLSIFKLLLAVRRKDDGPMTKLLSIIGWMAMFTGRLVVFTLFLTVLYTWLFPLFLAVHVLAHTKWVYSIAVEKWRKSSTRFNSFPLIAVIFIVFGLPSLLLWPMMFALNRRGRPLMYLFVVLLENAAMLGAWYLLKVCHKKEAQLSAVDWHFVVLAAVGTVLGTLVLLFYYCTKPKRTEKIVDHDIDNQNNLRCAAENNKKVVKREQYGLYYEFCRVVFPLKVKREFADELSVLRATLPERSVG